MENALRIDSVPTTQSELGPRIPDGGYGWIIVLASTFFHLLIPSLVVSFGVIMAFLRLEMNGSSYPDLWDNPLIYTPLFFMAIWTLMDPWFRKLIEHSKWPRLVTTAGVCLVCAGLLSVWFAVVNGNRRAPWFVTAGTFAGLGASIVTAQTEVIVAQYFRLRLLHVNVWLQIVGVLGFVLTPILLGDHILAEGVPKVILWYQAIILQGIIVSMLIKKPGYLKSEGNPYKLIHQASQDEEVDVFAKNSTELQNARHTLEPQASTSTSSEATIGISSVEVHPKPSSKQSWVTFEDEEDVTKPNTNTGLRKSFQKTEGDKIEIIPEEFPTPLFTENHINNNTSYAFDTAESPDDSEPRVFVPNTQIKVGFFESNFNFLLQPTFYKSLLQIICWKFSVFMFYAMFPSFVYMRIVHLNIHHATHLVGSVSTVALVFVIAHLFLSPTHKMKAFFLWISSWVGALGYVLLTDVHSEIWFVLGSILIILSMQSLQYFGQPLLNVTRKGETTRIHLWLSTFTGIAFMIFFVIDFSYVNSFRMLALMHFVTGGVWFANFIFKKLKPVLLNRS